MPVLNVVDGLVAIVFGYYAFQEIPRHSPFFLLIEAFSFAAIATGLVVVARLETEQAEDSDTPPVQTGVP